jgi:hypothetical protein
VLPGNTTKRPDYPRHMAEALAIEPQIELMARDLAKCRDVLYLGRGTSYPLAWWGVGISTSLSRAMVEVATLTIDIPCPFCSRA